MQKGKKWIMSELINRQMVIDALKKISFSYWFECGEYLSEDVREMKIISSNKALEVIGALPSAQPEPHWIPCSERLPENEYVLISKKQTMISGDKWSVAIAVRMADPRSGKIQWRDSGFGVYRTIKYWHGCRCRFLTAGDMENERFN